MSIQELRERYAKSRPVLASMEPAWLKNFEASMEKRGADHPAELRRMARDAHAKMRELISASDYTTAKHGVAAEAANALHDLLAYQADLHGVFPDPAPGSAGGNSGWRNADTGEAVTLYGPGDRLASAAPGGVSMGAVLAGLLRGPKSDDVRNILVTGTDSAGGFSVPRLVSGTFIDRLRAATRVIEAGAQTLPLEGRTRLVRIDTDPAVAWRAEAAAVTQADPAYSALDLNPKSLDVLVRVSEELLQDSVNLEAMLEASLLGAMSVELDRAAMFGAGSATEPLGVFGTAGVTSLSMGTNGAVPSSWDNILDLLFEIETRNAAPSAAIMHPRTLRTYRKLKDSTGQPLRTPAPLDTLPMLATTSVPIAQTQGTSNDASTILLGDWRNLIIGVRQQLTIRVLDQTFAATREVGFMASLRADFGVAVPGSFARLIGIRP